MKKDYWLSVLALVSWGAMMMLPRLPDRIPRGEIDSWALLTLADTRVWRKTHRLGGLPFISSALFFAGSVMRSASPLDFILQRIIHADLRCIPKHKVSGAPAPR